MAPTPLCAGCQQKVPIRENLYCALCKCRYDLECAGVSKEYYSKTMTLEHKKMWKCQTCICQIPKTGNTDTPIRTPRHPDYIHNLTSPTDGSNVTMRKKTMNCNEDTICSENLSLLGDTIRTQENLEIFNDTQAQLTMQNLSELIISRLKENNKSIIHELQNTIQTEIKKAIIELREDFNTKTSALTIENNRRIQDIESINIEIENLRTENENLKKEIKELSLHTSLPQRITEVNRKKIVLYGLGEYYKEPECELHNRLIELFRDVMNVDLSGYIEDMYRVGRKGIKSRPLVIELLSKRMTKYVINNNQYFQGTGLFISEFLDANARKERAQMREELFKARKNGLHAIIKNNKLYIEGKPIKMKDYTINQQHLNSTIIQENDIMETNNTDQTCHRTTLEETINNTFRKQRPNV